MARSLLPLDRACILQIKGWSRDRRISPSRWRAWEWLRASVVHGMYFTVLHESNFAPHKRVSGWGSSRLLDPCDFPARADSPFTRWNALDWCELDEWKQTKSSRPVPRFWAALRFSRSSKTVWSQRGFGLGRILDLHKPELPIPDLSSGRQQTPAPLGPCSQRMPGMQSQLVGPVSVLRPDTGCNMAKPNPPLCSLQQTADTGNARGLAPCLQSFTWGGAIDVDKDTKLAILSLLDALRESMKGTSETRISSLRIHDLLVKACVPSYLGASECRFHPPLSELPSVENK